MIHLTHTGAAAGIPYCGQERDERHTYHHPNVKALEKPEYRARVCPHCPHCLLLWDEAGRDEPEDLA